MKDPAYYRDLINHILGESEEDIPLSPSLKDMKKRKFYRMLSSRKINRDVWLSTMLDDVEDEIAFFINIGDEQCEANAYWENNKLIFYENISYPVDHEKYQTYRVNRSEAWRKQVVQDILDNLHKSCLSKFHIDENFELNKWLNDGWLDINCPKFTEYLTLEFSGLNYLMGGEFEPMERDFIIRNFIEKGKRI